jgi:hypothetical protein
MGSRRSRSTGPTQELLTFDSYDELRDTFRALKHAPGEGCRHAARAAISARVATHEIIVR